MMMMSYIRAKLEEIKHCMLCICLHCRRLSLRPTAEELEEKHILLRKLLLLCHSIMMEMQEKELFIYLE